MTLVGLVATLIVKPSGVIASGYVITALARRAPAATRHAMWVAVVVIALVSPLLAPALPRWRLEALDAGARRVNGIETLTRPRVPATEFVTVRADDSLIRVPRARAVANPSTLDERLAWIAFAVWSLVGAALVLQRIGAERRARRFAARAGAAPEHVRHIASSLIHRTRGVDVRTSPEVQSPAVVGLFTSIMLLPERYALFSDDELEAILLHEVSHIERRDCLLNFLADLAACVYWCNPMVHMAAGRVRLESDRACDETVVRSGADADEYAELLLRVARADRGGFTLAPAASAMSRSRELEFRIRALIRAPVRRLSRATSVCAVVTGVGLALPSAALTVSSAVSSAPQIAAREPDQTGDSLADPRSELVPLHVDDRTIALHVRDVLAGPDSMLAMPFVHALQHVPRHENDFVRERARWVLSRVTSGALREPLLTAFDDPDWRVQAYAAWALGVFADTAAVPRLIPLVSHPVWRLRAMAASALAQTRDPRAWDAMRAALDDPAWQVRTEAVSYLAAVGGAKASELLRSHLDDRHLAVRAAVRRALDTTQH